MAEKDPYDMRSLHPRLVKLLAHFTPEERERILNCYLDLHTRSILHSYTVIYVDDLVYLSGHIGEFGVIEEVSVTMDGDMRADAVRVMELNERAPPRGPVLPYWRRFERKRRAR